MRSLVRPSILSTFGVVLGLLGCGTMRETEAPTVRAVQAEKTGTPFLERGDYPEQLGVTIQEIFTAHQFLQPWIVVRGPDFSRWFVAERSVSPQRFDRLYVQITPERKVSASITPYQFGPSDWATLGRFFVDFGPEADSVAAEISKRLSSFDHAVRRAKMPSQR